MYSWNNRVEEDAHLRTNKNILINSFFPFFSFLNDNSLIGLFFRGEGSVMKIASKWRR